ncbi:hypothetical protein AARAC_007766 [Aspergillus arachidicola]|uniref:Uncharacterized protein n=1 Tax=Aspergillus arachidicola TaxID=656916 RepID=A0A2G7FJD4_9EURO|nr:hypothetical protein AARAC_007766 [Aspergillus arachidicola]
MATTWVEEGCVGGLGPGQEYGYDNPSWIIRTADNGIRTCFSLYEGADEYEWVGRSRSYFCPRLATVRPTSMLEYREKDTADQVFRRGGQILRDSQTTVNYVDGYG